SRTSRIKVVKVGERAVTQDAFFSEHWDRIVICVAIATSAIQRYCSLEPQPLNWRSAWKEQKQATSSISLKSLPGWHRRYPVKPVGIDRKTYRIDTSPVLAHGSLRRGVCSNFKRRDEIILCPGTRKRKVSLGVAGVEKSQKQKVGSGSWARLLKRFFAIDVSRCPRCGTELEIIAAVLDLRAGAKLLTAPTNLCRLETMGAALSREQAVRISPISSS
ncbi:hypothetical protein DAPPUDRAFT_124714, partial [Daphnia pulex]